MEEERVRRGSGVSRAKRVAVNRVHRGEREKRGKEGSGVVERLGG